MIIMWEKLHRFIFVAPSSVLIHVYFTKFPVSCIFHTHCTAENREPAYDLFSSLHDLLA